MQVLYLTTPDTHVSEAPEGGVILNLLQLQCFVSSTPPL